MRAPHSDPITSWSPHRQILLWELESQHKNLGGTHSVHNWWHLVLWASGWLNWFLVSCGHFCRFTWNYFAGSHLDATSVTLDFSSSFVYSHPHHPHHPPLVFLQSTLQTLCHRSPIIHLKCPFSLKRPKCWREGKHTEMSTKLVATCAPRGSC